MISMAVLGRYARSVADVAFELGEVDSVSRDLSAFNEIFRAVPDLLLAFDNPAIPRDTKSNILSVLLSRYPVGKIAENFLRVLLEHNRIRHFGQIYESYIKAVNDRKGIVTAKVMTASVMSEDQMAELRESLSRAIRKTVILDVRTDASLLGGLVVQVGSTVYDGSIRKQLDEMKKHLMD